MKKAVYRALIIVFSLLLIFSGYKLIGIYSEYKKADDIKQNMMVYRPADETISNESTIGIGEMSEPIINPALVQAQADHPDVVGWITIDNTGIDYLIVQTDNNQYYLKHDVNGDYLGAGSIFMDYRCNRDFNAFNSIIYGHRMKKSGSMFADLANYREESYFNSHLTGTLYTPTSTNTLDIFAFMIIGSTDDAYNVTFNSDEDIESHLKYIKSNAKWYRDEVSFSPTDRILTMSTCTYEFENARAVLIAKIDR